MPLHQRLDVKIRDGAEFQSPTLPNGVKPRATLVAMMGTPGSGEPCLQVHSVENIVMASACYISACMFLIHIGKSHITECLKRDCGAKILSTQVDALAETLSTAAPGSLFVLDKYEL